MKLLPSLILIFCIGFLDAQDTIPDVILKGHKNTVFCIDFSTDNRLLVSGGWDNTIKVVNLSSGDVSIITNQYEPNIEEYYRNTYFSSISFTPDNEKLLFTLADKINGPASGITPDGKYLAASSRDETIKIWDLKKIISF